MTVQATTKSNPALALTPAFLRRALESLRGLYTGIDGDARKALGTLTNEWQPDYKLPFANHVYERLVTLGLAEHADVLHKVGSLIVPNHTQYRRKEAH